MTDGGARILLCVSGGIAAYKAPELVRALVKRGHEVQVVMTPAAEAFVTELSLATVSKRPVRRTLLDAAEEGRVGHIELADWPDLVVVAPATANLLARCAAGLADDLASTVLLATRAPVLWAPAMNTNMWRHPATQANLATLRARGAHFVGPDSGDLACGWIGEGRMIDPELIVQAGEDLLGARGRRDASWKGRHVLVSAGPTRAYLDPVRFVSNASTGAMGFALAEVAAARGADVTLVSGPVQRATPAGCRRIWVETADEMHQAMHEVLSQSRQDLVAMVAAVADVAPARAPGHKLAKKDLIEQFASGALVEGIDVLSTLVQRHGDDAFFLGFGAQTVDVDEPTAVHARLVEAGQRKLKQKGGDAIFVNRVGIPGHGFSSDTNTGVLIHAGGPTVDVGALMPKPALAGWLLDQLADPVADKGAKRP
jgi:phosphopantothenoylcysteine decarboxylase/phosphopantothenate--cysteine ligase